MKRRSYKNYYYSGDWIIESGAVFDYLYTNGRVFYKVAIVTKDGKTWEVNRRYSDFYDLFYQLKEIDIHQNRSLSQNDKITFSPNSDYQGVFNKNGSFPPKTIDNRYFHLFYLTRSRLDERRDRLSKWLLEVFAVIKSNQLPDFQNEKVRYELDWFLETGKHLNTDIVDNNNNNNK